jgi:hypothetical protein
MAATTLLFKEESHMTQYKPAKACAHCPNWEAIAVSPQVQALIKERPGGDLASIKAYYGKFSYTSNSDGSISQDSKWATKHLMRVSALELPHFPGLPTETGTKPVSSVLVHKKIREPLVLTWQEIVRRGLHLKFRTYNGVYNPRHISRDPNKPLSLHSWACAIDFDARWNGYGAAPTMCCEIVAVFEAYGWCWGGRWNTPDGMHFQWTDKV